MLLSRLKPVKYNHEDPHGNLQNLRKSILDKSLSRKKIKDLNNNPDINNFLQPIPEEFGPVNNSAPAKTHSQVSSTEGGQRKKKDCLDLKPHEELFFHYLSILALIPDKRQSILQILDTFG